MSLRWKRSLMVQRFVTDSAQAVPSESNFPN
jgi:hypothetical protein